MEVGERKGGRPLRYLSSTIKFHILTASKWPEHHHLFLSSSSPWFLSNVRRGRDNTERGKKNSNIAHSVTLRLLLLTGSLRSWLHQVVKGREWEEFFLAIPRRDMPCVISWNLRLTCETEGSKVERSSSEVAIETTCGCWPILPVLFCCFLVFHSLDSKFVATSLR